MDIAIYGIYVLTAILFSIAVVFVFGLTVHFSGRFGQWVLPGVVILLGVGSVLIILLSGRNLTFVGLSLENMYSGDGASGGGWVARILNWTLFAFGVTALLERVWVHATVGRQVPARTMWLVLLMFFSLSNSVASGLFGTHSGVTPGLFHQAVILAFLAVDDRWNLDALLRATRVSLLIVVVAGLVVFPVFPGLVLEQNVKGLLPFLNFRYWGATSHANAMGPLAVLLLLILYLKPFNKKSAQYASILLTAVTLILAQSKTALAGGLAAYGVVVASQLFQELSRGRAIGDWKLGDIGKLSLVVVTCFSVALALLFADLDKYVSRFSASSAGSSIATLSGRTAIWNVAIEEWRNNPVFGYGPGLFDVEHRARLGMNFAFHAHNQFLQSLAQSGAVGFAGLIIFLFVAGWKSIRYARQTKYVSVAILAFVLLRCVTEVPLRATGMYSGEFILMLVWIGMLIACDEHSRVETVSKANGAFGLRATS